MKNENKLFIGVITGLILISFTLSVSARDSNRLDKNCEPKGIAANLSYKYNPISFYKTQVESIIKDRNSYIQNRRLEDIANRQEIETNALEERHLRELGIQPYQDRKLDTILAETDRFLKKNQYELDQLNFKWYEKCLAYSKNKAGVN